MKFGAHISIANGLDKAVLKGKEINCDAIQLFVKNASSWTGRPIIEKEIEKFLLARKETKIDPVIAHSGYLINLAGTDRENYQKSYVSFLDELDRCSRLKIPYLVMHPGAHKGAGEAIGLVKIADSINKAFAEQGDSDVMLLLETTAGQGTYLGYKFSQLGWLIKKIEKKKRIGVCYDTQHTFAAGYDIRTKAAYKKTFDEFDSEIGIKNLRAFHFNDSMPEIGSRKDRHEHIGKGHIGLEGFRLLVNDKRWRDLPMILETPKDENYTEDIENLAVLRKLAVS